jgi:hypothetical protein
VLSSTNVDGDDETTAESQFVKEDIIPVAAIFGPHILKLDVHKVARRHLKNCERRHKGSSSPEIGLDIGAVDRGRSMGVPVLLHAAGFTGAPQLRPLCFVSARSQRFKLGGSLDASGCIRTFSCLILHIEYALAGARLARTTARPSNPHYPGGRARVIGPVADRSDLRHIPFARQSTTTCASPTAQQKARAFVDPALRDVASGKTELAKNTKGAGSREDAGSPADGRLQVARFGADESSVTRRSRR